MDAVSNNKLANTENQLKDFLQTVLSSEGIVVDIRRTFIEYNGVNRSRAFARHANRMASKGTDEKFVVIALMCYPALQWILRAQDIDKVIDELREQNADETICRMSNIQRMLESSVGCAKPQLRLEMRKVFFARCQELVDAVDDAMDKAVFLNPQSKPSKISLAMAMMRGSILESDPVSAVAIRNNFDSIVEDVTKVGGSTIKPLVMELAPNEGEAQSAEASFLFHNTEVLLREYELAAMEATLSASHDDGVFNPTDDELGEDEDDSLDLDSMLDVPGSPVDEAPDEPDVTEATKATTPVATEPPADTALPEQKDDSEQLPTKGKRSSRKKQKKDDDTPVTRTNAFQPNAKTQADEEDSSLVEKSIPFQTEAETRKERPKPTRTEHKKSSKTDAQTESLFGRDFQNRTKSGSGGSKKRSSSKKAQTIQSDGEQMRFDESNTDVIKCKV